MDADYDLDGDILTRDDSFSPERKYAMPLPRLLPSQQKVTELLSHLASYSELLVTVTGPDGSGKTTIAQALASMREEPEDTLLLTADLMLGMPAILAAIAGRWDLPRLPDDMVAARSMIRDAAIERSGNGGTLLVIIDQAEQMDSGTLNEIANFALQVPQLISFALFGVTGFADVIRENPANAPLHRLELDPLFPDEAAQLIQQVYAPGQALPLADDELDLICHQSDGRPGGILLAAEDYLLETAPAAKTPKAEKKPGRFPVTHILAIAAVAAAIGMSFLYSNSGDDSEPADLAVATQRIDLDSLPLSGSPEADAPSSADGISAVPESEVQTLSSFGDESTQTGAEAVASATDYNYGGGNKEVIAAVPVAPEVAEAPAVTPASKEIASPVQKLVQPEAVKPVTQAVKPAETKPASATAQRTAAEKTLLAAKSGFVVQLFGSYKSDSAAAFRKQWQQKVTGSLYQYQTVHSGRPWHVVVAGIFGTRAEAQAAVNAMPAELRRQSPWIRDVSAVQEVLR